ncbi:GNAT family N-acetyltransferase [Nanoarchaeota archaeon]
MVKFRKSKLTDAKQIAEILKAGFRISNVAEGIFVFKEESKTAHNYLVAEEEGKIVGIIVWRRIGLPKHRLGKIMRFHVLPGFEEIREEMFQRAVQALDKEYKNKKLHLRKIYLYVHSDNKALHKFYKELGLIHEATLKDHFYKGVDDYIFSIHFE